MGVTDLNSVNCLVFGSKRKRASGGTGPDVPLRVFVDTQSHTAHSYRRRVNLELVRIRIDFAEAPNAAIDRSNSSRGEPEMALAVDGQSMGEGGHVMQARNFDVGELSGLGIDHTE